MAHNIYVSSVEGNSGKSTVALGVIETLRRHLPRVGVFRPIARSTRDRDYVLEFLLRQDGINEQYDEAIGVHYDAVHENPEAALGTIVSRFRALESRFDAVVIVGSDFTDVATPTEFSFNARIAANLGAPVLLVLGGREGQAAEERLGQSQARDISGIGVLAKQAVEQLREQHAELFGLVINRADETALTQTVDTVTATLAADVPVWAIPENSQLVAPTMGAVMRAVNGTLIGGDPDALEHEALEIVVAGMGLNNVLDRLLESSVIIVPADRTELLLGVLTAQQAPNFPKVTGIVLNGGFELPDSIVRLMAGINSSLPIVTTNMGTFDTATAITHTHGQLGAESQRKRDLALALFERHVPAESLLARFDVAESNVVTPLMFEYALIERAREHRQRIVLPEGDDDRVLRAAANVLARDVADITLLGEPDDILARAVALGLDLSAARVQSTQDPEFLEPFAVEYQRLRAHKGIALQQARDIMADSAYFGTMMVQLGLADGMVSGAVHTTAHTIRPALEFIKTRPGVSVVSSVFLMAMADRVLVYGDCAVNPEPTAEQLADIAISSAQTAIAFGIEPRVAMLSYSTGESGSGSEVDKVREATALVRARRPDLPVAGPIQYDAAADPTVAATKLPDNPVAGRATVFIFPDLNTGNNTYKAVQRSAGAVAIGPVLQGLNKPVNDLSRGATVADIINTIAITAIQAQAQA